MEEKLISIPNNVPAKKSFGGLDEEYSNLKKAKVVVLQVPYEKTTTYKTGTKNGPDAIVDASANLELFDEELNQETFKIGIHTMNGLAIADLAPEDMVEQVRLSVLEVLTGGKFPAILGGEHSITPAAVEAFKELYPDLSVLQLDAHCDLRDEYRGSKHNHACAARRISEICPLVQVGARSLSKEEKDFLNANGNAGKVKSVTVYHILDKPFWKDEVSKALTGHVYVTIDLDVFDPSLVPAVGTPEPGGLGWYEMMDLLRTIAEDHKVVGFDIVELCPIKDQPASDFLAAKLLYRFLGYVFGNKK